MTEFLNPQQLIKELNIKPGIKAADFGCGSGNLTIALAHAVGPDGQVIAIDVLKTALKTVASRAKLEGLHNVFTIQANLEILNSSTLKNKTLGLVLLANVLFQSPNQQEMIAEAIRVLKQKGRLIIVDWKPDKLALGPKAKYRLSPEQVKNMVSLKLEKKLLNTGKYHFGLVFRKA